MSALREATQSNDTPAIHAAIAAIMGEIGSIPKTRKNTAQNYTFRGIADFYLACQPLMAKHGVHVTPAIVHSDEVHERPTKSGGTQFHVRMRIEFPKEPSFRQEYDDEPERVVAANNATD